jgi:hypothetical protein
MGVNCGRLDAGSSVTTDGLGARHLGAVVNSYAGEQESDISADPARIVRRLEWTGVHRWPPTAAPSATCSLGPELASILQG